MLYNAIRRTRQHSALPQGTPFAYVISDKQADTPEAGLLAQKMIDSGIDVYTSKSGFKANGVSYPADVGYPDDHLLRAGKELFERQRYPDALENGTSKASICRMT